MDRAEAGLQPLCLQRIFHDILLPGGDKIIAGVLQLTATAGFIVATGRLNAVLGWRLDPNIGQLRALPHTADLFIWQGTGRKKRAEGDTIALVSKAGDGCCGSGYICHLG